MQTNQKPQQINLENQSEDKLYTKEEVMKHCSIAFIQGWTSHNIFLSEQQNKQNKQNKKNKNKKNKNQNQNQNQNQKNSNQNQNQKSKFKSKFNALTRKSNEYKLVLIVNMGLGMRTGKIAAQCGHATLSAYKKALKLDPNGLRNWENSGQPKITLKAPNTEYLVELDSVARSLNIPSARIYDAGRTQVESGSFTCLAIGPALGELIDQITGNLKLL
ncbi:peptidyl-tRNA hydrolase 2 [Anaeramoeba ignava]|uniref:peptidyl-tRNA hydrolase n=1 Tax=Anaeramoeba ignava TaxID=1746090 RepID=A0A9Q0LA98_ANAIG|nr:peptidyl-tRNA hydrolase 2 [Anaeramoeba ignava]